MNAKTLAKKFAAISMIAAMVVTAPAVAFAATESGGVTSSGSSNGHVGQKKTMVTLPTITAEDLEFIVDPERLIDATSSAAAGGGYVGYMSDGNTITANAAGVYFKKNEAQSGSAAFHVLNVGTNDVDITMTATKKAATDGATVMALTSDAAIFDAGKITTGPASLFMGLYGGHYKPATAGYTGSSALNGDVNVSAITDQAAKVTMTLSGSTANYAVTASSAGYDFKLKSDVTTVTDPAANFWDYGEFSLEGACQQGDATDLDAPEFEITWSWEGADDEYGAGIKDGYATVQKFGNTFVLLTKPSESTTFTGLTADSQITSFELKLNDGNYVNAKDKVMIYEEMAGITYNDAVTKVGEMQAGDVVTVKIVVDGNTYVSPYTVS
jgi:hypothetical protein